MSQFVLRQAYPVPSPAVAARAALGALGALALCAALLRAPETPEASAPRLNVDPISGKLLDRIDGLAAPAASDSPARTAPRDALVSFAPAADPSPVARKTVAVKPARAAPAKSEAAGRKPSAEKPAAPAPDAGARQEPQARENESWWSRWSPGALTTRAPAMGRDLTNSVVAGAGSVGRALIDRLPAPGL